MAHWFKPIHLIIQIDDVTVPKFYNIFPLHLWYSRPFGMSFEFTIDANKQFKKRKSNFVLLATSQERFNIKLVFFWNLSK